MVHSSSISKHYWLCVAFFLSPPSHLIPVYIYVYNISLSLLEWPKVPVQETTPAPRGVFGEGKTCAVATSMMPTI